MSTNTQALTNEAAIPARAAAVKPKARSRRVVVVGAFFVVGGLLLAALLWPRAVVVDLAVVDRGLLLVTVEEEGKTRMQTRAVLAAPVAGLLVPPSLRAGDSVKAGQVLARLHPLPAPLLPPAGRAELDAAVRAAGAAVDQARAGVLSAASALQTANDQLDRQQRLYAGGGASRVSVDDARATADAARHELEAARSSARVAEQQHAQQIAARARATSTTAGDAPLSISSPLTGVILRVLQEDGVVVAAGTPVIEVGDPRSLEIVVPLLTADVVTLPPAAAVIASAWGGPPLHGRVRTIEPMAFTKVSALGVEEQRTNVVVDLDNDDDDDDDDDDLRALGDGYAVQADIVRFRGDDVVRVPAGALFRRGDGWAAFVVQDGRARERVVQVGHRAGPLAEATAGLDVGDLVVIYPGDRVWDGARVRQREAAP